MDPRLSYNFDEIECVCPAGNPHCFGAVQRRVAGAEGAALRRCRSCGLVKLPPPTASSS